ncbi:MAG: hypothetical protein ACTS3F_01465 [Phycisphaerales bacterium]
MSRKRSGMVQGAPRVIAPAVLLACASTVMGQDSVASTPGASDALAAKTGPQRVRYVVDLVSLSSSWGNGWLLGPVMKAGADDDPMFGTQLLGSASASPDVLDGVSFGATDFAVWTAAGAGVNPAANTPAGAISINGYDRQFGVAFSDISLNETNAIGATVGFDAGDPSRVYVTRVVGMADALAGVPSLSTISLGAIDASGNLAVRFDNFNTVGAQQVNGENLALIDLEARNSSVNTAIGSVGLPNVVTDAGSTTIVQNAGSVITNVPTLVPESLGGPVVIGFDFASQASANGSPIAGHLAAGLAGHRGNPSFSGFDVSGGGSSVGLVASLARADGSSRTQSINLMRTSPDGQADSAFFVTLPVGLSDGTETVNTDGAAEFHQYLSQVGFRGPNGLVGVGYDPSAGAPLVCATGVESGGMEFIAAATVGGGSAWRLVAYPGKAILDGANGASVGSIVDASPATFSAPGADGLGNIYFVARQQDAGGAPANALIKAVRVGSGYQLERVLVEGQSFVGANSTRSYTVTGIRLGDSDSLASGGFHGGQVIPAQVPGRETGDAASPFAVGGLVVNATLEYDNGGIPEVYEAVLFVGPGEGGVTPVCPGDLNGDNLVDSDDLGILLGAFGTGPGGDLDGNGETNSDDLGILLSAFGTNCN